MRKQFSRLYWHPNKFKDISWLAQVHQIRNPSDAITFLKMRYPTVGYEVARIQKRIGRDGKVDAYSPSTVCNWCKPQTHKDYQEMDDEQIDAIGVLLANAIEPLAKRAYPGIKIEHNSPWHVTVWSKCYCGRWYKLKRTTDVGCRYHRKHK